MCINLFLICDLTTLLQLLDRPHTSPKNSATPESPEDPAKIHEMYRYLQKRLWRGYRACSEAHIHDQMIKIYKPVCRR